MTEEGKKLSQNPLLKQTKTIKKGRERFNSEKTQKKKMITEKNNNVHKFTYKTFPLIFVFV